MATTEPHATGVRAEDLQPLLDGRGGGRLELLDVRAMATGPRCKAVTRAVNELCNGVRGDAEALVDAFGIPDEVLRAPIGVR